MCSLSAYESMRKIERDTLPVNRPMIFLNLNMRLLVILLSGFVLVGCLVNQGSNPRRFSFYKEDRPLDLALQVPKGFSSENIRYDGFGKEQFYRYPDGSVFFVGLNMRWPTKNQERGLVLYADTLLIKSVFFKGIDKNGLHFRETWFDHFVVGYSFVKPSQTEAFERAVHSVRFKRPSK
jgi:hypothetical protein